jgi:hypothetical protein
VTVPARQHLVSLAGGVLLIAPYALAARHLLPGSTLVQLAVRVLALVLFVGIVAQLRLVSAADLAKVSGRLGKLPLLRRFIPKTA